MKFKIAFGKKDYERAIVKMHLLQEVGSMTQITDRDREEAFEKEVSSLEELGFQFVYYNFDLRKDYYEQLLECQVEDFQCSMQSCVFKGECGYDIKKCREYIHTIARTVTRMKCKEYEVKNKFALKCYEVDMAPFQLFSEYIRSITE